MHDSDNERKDEQRGTIRNRQRASQLRDFRGLRWGAITPTDFDMFVEFGNRLHVYGEAKLTGAPMADGQKLALERAVDACKQPCMGVVCEHPNAYGDIDFARCTVRELRWPTLSPPPSSAGAACRSPSVRKPPAGRTLPPARCATPRYTACTPRV